MCTAERVAGTPVRVVCRDVTLKIDYIIITGIFGIHENSREVVVAREGKRRSRGS